MGNTVSELSVTRTTGALDSFTSELGSDIAYEKSLGTSRFLKTVKCGTRNGPLVVKFFIKPDPDLSLRTYASRLKADRDALKDIPNIYSYRAFLETEKAGYAVRQWLEGNLYDRISTRPFLNPIEKKWIAFQLISGMRDARRHNISHGDIKSENVLVTSWNWVYITDFASYKPTYLPLDDPADFSFFFDTSGRRTCYIAPERFYTAGSEISKIKAQLDFHQRDGKVSEAMDVFSLGCVIAELFLEGTAMFTLSQLFKYRATELSLESHLAAIDDVEVRSLILRMVALDPANRPTFDTLLHSSRGIVFPETFYSFLRDYVASVNELSTTSVFTKEASASNPGEQQISGDQTPLPNDSDHRIEKIWSEYESIEAHFFPPGAEGAMDSSRTTIKPMGRRRRLDSIFPVELYIPDLASGSQEARLSGQHAALEDGVPLIILSLVCANIRNCIYPSSKAQALDILLALACHLTDEAKLDRLVPYVIDLLHDDAAIVRGAALRTLVQVLMLVKAITPSNASIFPEYIFPNIRYLYKDTDVSVRCVLAQSLAPLADTSQRYLEMGQALKAHSTFKVTHTDDPEEPLNEISYDACLQELQSAIQDILVSLLVDSSSVVKRAILHNVSPICIFLGRQRTNDVLLGHMITYLNDRDWLLRYAFFESIVDVAACVGNRSLDEYIFPLMVQALSDEEETVISRVLASLTSLSELGLFQRMRLWDLMSYTLGFLFHPDMWIRQGAVAFMASATRHLPPSDTWCILYPSLKYSLRSDVKAINEKSLLLALKPPLPRQHLEAALSWAMKADKTNVWKSPSSRNRTTSKPDTPKEELIAVKKQGRTSLPPTEEDEMNLMKLRALGMTSSDEHKLFAMRDHISKLANVIASSSVRARESELETLAQVTTAVELQKLGVVPQTVFVGGSKPEPSKTLISRKTSDVFSRHSTVSTRTGSIEHINDDLRRRLASYNGSSTSPLTYANDRERHISATSSARPSVVPSPVREPSTPSEAGRPSSPAESAVSSTVDGPSLRPRTHLYVGSTDNQKAPAAVGSVKANATGHLEAPHIPRLEDESLRSGRSSPVSNAGTVRDHRSSVHSIRPYSLSFETREPGLHDLLEQLYHENSREGLHDFGPRIHEGALRRRNAPRQNVLSMHGSGHRPEASLIANLTSHSGPISGIAVAPDHAFFVTCSDDRTVKVWDTARLERNVTSKPRQTYSQHHACVKAVCMLEGLHCFASAGEDGSLHVVRVQVVQGASMPKYGKLQIVREHRVDQVGEYITALSHYNTETSSNIIYVTTHARIVVLDLRTMRVLQMMQTPQHHGPIVTFSLDKRKTWVLVATVTGFISLWDLRFGLLIKSWKAGIEDQPVRIYKCIVHPTKGRGRWVMVALEAQCSAVGQSKGAVLVEVWDIETTTLVETFELRDPSSDQGSEIPHVRPSAPAVADQEAEKDPAAAIRALLRLNVSSELETSTNEEPHRPLDICAMVGGADFAGLAGMPRTDFLLDRGSEDGVLPRGGGGYVVTGSEDRKIRLWDLANIERSVILSGVEVEGERALFTTVKGESGEPVAYVEMANRRDGQLSNQNQRAASRTTMIAQHQLGLLKGHQDCITALACVDYPFRGGIISGDRAGVVKVWRVEEVQ